MYIEYTARDIRMHMNGSFSLVALMPCFSQIPAVQAVAILMLQLRWAGAVL